MHLLDLVERRLISNLVAKNKIKPAYNRNWIENISCWSWQKLLFLYLAINEHTLPVNSLLTMQNYEIEIWLLTIFLLFPWVAFLESLFSRLASSAVRWMILFPVLRNRFDVGITLSHIPVSELPLPRNQIVFKFRWQKNTKKIRGISQTWQFSRTAL